MEKELKEARNEINKGNIVIFPTETAYGVAADATDSNAVEKVYNAKERPKSKGLTTIVKDKQQAKEYGRISRGYELREELRQGIEGRVGEKV
ncbi:MAG: L-threonylcarbamoyladenylate synthase [Candidatus Nanohaloarchaea archaeon]